MRLPSPACCVLFAAATFLGLLPAGCSREGNLSGTDAAGIEGYLGRAACIECHQAQHDAFVGSHHDLAMQPATAATVLGDFDGASMEHFGVVSRFSLRDGEYLVETDGPDGGVREFRVAYTFGVTPLQQYLVEFPGGRLQVLPTCWDSRPEDEGGQRWFHLYADEAIPAGDELHWTGRNQNWNYMCAECHSTDLHKNYDPATDAFDTRWSEIDVSCEACHGPGSEHVEWARRAGTDVPRDTDSGLVVDLKDRDNGGWLFSPGEPTASRGDVRGSWTEIETCARCHARRGGLTDDYQHASVLLDSHRVSLLTQPEYFADGQVREEDYVYGSFLQSRMYHAGVTCTDCHDPHTARLRASGDALCFQCHQPSIFGVESHSRHPVKGGDGSVGESAVSCVGCHMPARTYMGVDDRHDHSFRVPRPDLSAKLGTPNACTICHSEKNNDWAAAAIAEWYGPGRRHEWRFGEALHAGQEGLPGAVEHLVRLTGDTEQPAIARATGLELFGRYPGLALTEAVHAGSNDADPLVRLGALLATAGISPEDRVALVGGLLTDPVLGVRAEAARVLAESVDETSPEALRLAFGAAAAEFVATQNANAERPESHVNLAVFYTIRGQFDDAEAEYLAALALDPGGVAASVNFADLRRVQGRDADSERLLRDALRRWPQNAATRHSLGLTLIRLERRDEALLELGRAADWAPGVARHGYVYGVALDSLGQAERAIEVLRETRGRHPYDRDVLAALEGMCRQRGLLDEAAAYARTLRELSY